MQQTEHKQFLLFMRDALVTLCTLLLLCISLWLLSRNNDAYAAILPQKIAWAANAPVPRLLLIGGSGVAEGVDSPMLESETGLHPVNMGIFAGVGLRFMFVTIAPKVQRGDTILIMPEYELMQQPLYGDGFLLLEMLHANPGQIVHVLVPHSLLVMTRSLPTWMQIQAVSIFDHRIKPLFVKTTPTFAECLYSVRNFNTYGDVDSRIASTTHMSEQEVETQSVDFVRPSADLNTLALLKNFIAQEEAFGAHVFVVPPAVATSVYEKNTDAISKQFLQLTQTIGSGHILGTPANFIFPNDGFIDSLGHLTYPNKEDRTERVIKLLKAHL